MSDILKKYNLTFATKDVNDEKVSILDSTNKVFTPIVNVCLEFEDPLEIQNYINGINRTISGADPYNVFLLITCIRVGHITTQIFKRRPGEFVDFDHPILEIPSKDFADILTEWRAFLLQPIA